MKGAFILNRERILLILKQKKKLSPIGDEYD